MNKIVALMAMTDSGQTVSFGTVLLKDAARVVSRHYYGINRVWAVGYVGE